MSADRQPESPRDAVERAAAAWQARREGGLDLAGQAELRAWLAADPAHPEALARLDTSSSALDWPLYSGNLDRVLEGVEARSARRRTRRRLAAAGVAASLLLGAFFIPRWLPADSIPPPISLAVHTPRVLSLPDGSTAELKDGAELRVAFEPDARRVVLLRGAAHFKVREDASRPFLVTAGSITARAVGTAFLVDVEAKQLALVVTEGRVAVDHNARAASRATTLALVHAGESVTVGHTGAASAPAVTSLDAVDAARRLEWRTPRLTFNGTALRDVVTMLNRHNREQLVVTDPSLGSLRLSGTLRADRLDALLGMLNSDFGIVASREGDRILLQRGGG